MSSSRGDGGLDDSVSRFATELEGLSESELQDLAEDSLGFTESWFGDGSDCLGFGESWFGDAEAGSGESWFGDAWPYEVNYGSD